MSLTSVPLPADCQQTLRRILDKVTQKELDLLVSVDPAFANGSFRAGNTKIAKLRLEQVVFASASISQLIRKTLASHSRAQSLTEKLSIETLSELFFPLMTLLTRPVFIIALLLDARPEAQALAENELKEPSPLRPLTPEEASSRFCETLADLPEMLGASSTPGVAPTKESWQEQKEQLNQTIRELRKELTRLKGVDDRASFFMQKEKKTNEKLQQTIQQLDAANHSLLSTKQRLHDTEIELQRETNHREERLKISLDLALAEEFSGWLLSAKETEKAAKESLNTALLQKAEAALREQAAEDRHSGNRDILSARLRTFEETYNRVTAALRNAIHQTPALKAVASELTAEISRLTALINPNQPQSELATRLCDVLHQAEEDALPELRNKIHDIQNLGLLTNEDHKFLTAEFRRRNAAAHTTPLPDDLIQRTPGEKMLCDALAARKDLILLIDGHNVLFGLPTRYNPPRGKNRSEAEKREALVNDLVALIGENPLCRAWIVFDGKIQTDGQAAHNIRVSYSGGEGEHRADKVLLDNIRFFRQQDPSIPLLLVSDDRDLCAQAKKLGSETLPVLTYGTFLKNNR